MTFENYTATTIKVIEPDMVVEWLRICTHAMMMERVGAMKTVIERMKQVEPESTERIEKVQVLADRLEDCAAMFTKEKLL